MFAVAASFAQAKNVDLSTVPARHGVQLTIYNSEDLTLVRETRKVTFKKGVNPLQFTWANTLIDPTSVAAAVSHPARQAGGARHDLPARQAADALLERAERDGRRGDGRDHLLHQRHHLVGRLRVHCQPGRDGDGLRGLRPGVQQLRRRVRGCPGAAGRRARSTWWRRSPSWPRSGCEDVSQDGRRTTSATREAKSAKQAMEPRSQPIRCRCRARACPQKPKEIIKEGLSEYFIYTIEGTETIPNGWSKRMRSFEGTTVPFKIQYRYRPAGIRRPAGADVSADQRQGVEARHDAAAGRHGPRLPRQRPRRAVLPGRPSRSSTSPSATRSS